MDKEADTLQAFYDSVKMRAEGIDSPAGKQSIVVELYDKFFRNAFPKMTERLGIVYTPVEVVDLIIHSVNEVLDAEFGQTLGSDNVHIIDPFVGTGTFITRLMQSGLLTREQLVRNYKHEIHANEIVLLAYYIAAINIEAVYHGAVGGDYQPFEGICLTDTFQMYEKDDLVSALLEDNSARRKAVEKARHQGDYEQSAAFRQAEKRERQQRCLSTFGRAYSQYVRRAIARRPRKGPLRQLRLGHPMGQRPCWCKRRDWPGH